MSNQNVSPVVNNEENIESLFAELGLSDESPMQEDDEIIEISTQPGEPTVESAMPVVSNHDEDDELAAVRSLETSEAIEKHYESSDATEVAPTDVPQVAKQAKTKKEKVDPEVKKAERAAKKAAKDAAKPAKAERKFYTSKLERVTDKLGSSLGEYTVLTLSDAALTGADLEAKQKETMDLLEVGQTGIKVQNRITMIMEFVAGKSTKLNEVIERAFRLLKSDGDIKSGEKGNLHQNLLAKPYSPAAARAMGNNTIAAMRKLKVIEQSAGGVYVRNPESLIAMKVDLILGL